MRLCRININGQPQLAFYDEQRVVLFSTATKAHADKMGRKLDLPASESLLDFLPPAGKGFAAAKELSAWLAEHPAVIGSAASIPTSAAELLVPIPRPNKIFLLAGNYTEHIKEGGGEAPERTETFPYVFMKPPTTTLTDPNKPIRIPKVSPGAIDWELELGVIIGKTVKGISEADALSCVAGYTVINDISNRKFRPNADRKKRDKDAFFDWLHGKWHDSFCPVGPCITSADAIPDPQTLKLELKLNGEMRQISTTAAMIFPVAALIEFISAISTLEPGDIISTGTPAGVGSTTGTFLKPGDVMHASIGSIGTLVSPVVAE